MGIPVPPEGTTELGVDIIKIERIVAALRKHGRRFPLRILTRYRTSFLRW